MIARLNIRHLLILIGLLGLLGPVGLVGLVATTAEATTSQGSVSLVPASRTVHAGSTLAVTLVNDSDARVSVGFCVTLQRKSGSGWVTVTHTHGVSVACPAVDILYPTAISAHAQRSLPTVPIYDDLTPGTYRITLPYRRTVTAGVQSPIGADAGVASVTLRVLKFTPGPEPRLSRTRILTLARAAAKAYGDAHPTSVQSVENTEFEVNLVGTGDTAFDWSWAYLIVARGHFSQGGTVLVLQVNARTGKTLAIAVERSYPKIRTLGTVTTDLGAG